jgi:signal transduction histidine kinase
MMKTPVQRRLIGLVTAIVLVGLGIAFLTVKLQWQAAELRMRLNQVDSESFGIANQFADLLRQLNESLYHYGRSHVSPDVAAFNKTSHELDLWIDVQKPKLTSAQERAIMEQIDAAYDDYMRAARELLARLDAIGEASATMDEYDNLRKESQRLFELRRSLAQAHLASKDRVMARVGAVTTQLRVLVLISLGLLCVFALALGLVVYRDMILPLRLKLVESESLRDRQEKLASLGVLAAGVAHEIRNPLTAIKGVVFLQQKELQPDSKEYADAKIVEREILRLERIVNDFLLLSHPADSKLAPITADAPLREVQALLAPELAGDGIQLLLADEAPPLPVSADAEQIKQVLINLVRNGAEAIGQHGVVKLRARSDRRRLAGKETRVVILEVEDNGKGIPAEVQKRLFDPFFTTKDTGTGLGLSIAVRIVQSHGGLLEYQTTPGLGTTFGIVLPARPGHSDLSAR